MSNLEALTLGDEQLPTVKLHTTAVFSILSSFMRRGENARVMGTLLGIIKEGCVEVFDSFEVPFKEYIDEVSISFDHEYHKKMYEFHRRINKRETIVGWYSTTTPSGDLIVPTTSLVNDFYLKQCKKAVHVVVDTTLSSGNFQVRGFVGRTLKVKDERPFANLFSELKVSLEMSESEATCLYHMIHGQGSAIVTDPATGEDVDAGPWTSSEMLSTLPTESERVASSLEKLVSTLDELQAYVDGVVDGSKPAFTDIGVALSDAIGSLNVVSAEDSDSIFRDKMQDLLMVAYLSTLTQTQVQLSEKLHALL